MKKTIITIFSFILTTQLALAGGLVTNTNQSATWVRMMARDASVDVDAVFFNPAGLTHLEDGFYFQLNSQTVTQTRTVTSTFPGLNNGEYTGNTFVPFLPTLFGVYKKGNLAVSGGFTVIGGGGSAEFENGLPDFEYKLTALPSSLAALQPVGEQAGVDLTVTGYDVNSYIKGTSAYFGFQGAVSYKLNDMISVALGARYVYAINKYEGNIKNISVINGGETMRADAFLNNKAIPTLNGISAKLTQGVTQLNTVSDAVKPFLGQFGGVTLADGRAAGAISDEQYAALIQAGKAIGMDDPSVLTLQQYYDGINLGISNYNGKITQIDGTAAALAESAKGLADKELDVEQKGSGITPFVSLDFDLGNLGFAIKYEMKTNMNVTTTVTKDQLGLFTDGEEVPSDMPAMLSLGARYKTGGLKLMSDFHYYFDKDAKYGRKDTQGKYVTNGEEVNINGDKSYLDGNSIEFALGAEYNINSMFGISAGYLMADSKPNPIFQTSLSHALSTTTFGFGGIIHATPKLDIDLGVSFTSYNGYEKNITTPVAYKESYDKTATIFALGATLKL